MVTLRSQDGVSKDKGVETEVPMEEMMSRMEQMMADLHRSNLDFQNTISRQISELRASMNRSRNGKKENQEDQLLNDKQLVETEVEKEPIPQLQIPDSQKVDAETELPQHPVGGTIISHLSPLVPRVQFQEDLVRMVDEVMGFAIDDCFRGTQLFDPGGFNCIKDSGVLLFGSHQLEAQVRGVFADSLIVGVARESQPEVLHHIRTLLLPYTFSGVAQTRVESRNTTRVWKPGGPYCETDLGVEMFPCLAAFGVTLKQHFWYTISDIRMLNSQKKKWWIKEFAWFQKLHERKCFLQSIGLVEISDKLILRLGDEARYGVFFFHNWTVILEGSSLFEGVDCESGLGEVVEAVVGPTMKQLLSILAKKTAMRVEPEQEWHETFIQGGQMLQYKVNFYEISVTAVAETFGCVNHADTPGVVMMAVIVNTYKLKHKWRYKKEKCLANALMGEDQMLDQALNNTHTHISPSLNRIWEPGAFQFQIFFSNVHYLDLEVKVSRGGEICYRNYGSGWASNIVVDCESRLGDVFTVAGSIEALLVFISTQLQQVSVHIWLPELMFSLLKTSAQLLHHYILWLIFRSRQLLHHYITTSLHHYISCSKLLSTTSLLVILSVNCVEFFSIDFTPMELKVKLASNHFEGQLLRQFQELFEKLSLASMMFEQTFSSITEPKKILPSFFCLKHKWRSRPSHSFSEMKQRMIWRVWKSSGYLMVDMIEEGQKLQGDSEPLMTVPDFAARSCETFFPYMEVDTSEVEHKTESGGRAEEHVQSIELVVRDQAQEARSDVVSSPGVSVTRVGAIQSQPCIYGRANHVWKPGELEQVMVIYDVVSLGKHVKLSDCVALPLITSSSSVLQVFSHTNRSVWEPGEFHCVQLQEVRQQVRKLKLSPTPWLFKFKQKFIRLKIRDKKSQIAIDNEHSSFSLRANQIWDPGGKNSLHQPRKHINTTEENFIALLHQYLSSNLEGNDSMVEKIVKGFPEVFEKKAPDRILERKMVKRQGQAVTKVLVKWLNEAEEEATWEFLFNFQKQYPDFEA